MHIQGSRHAEDLRVDLHYPEIVWVELNSFEPLGSSWAFRGQATVRKVNTTLGFNLALNELGSVVTLLVQALKAHALTTCSRPDKGGHLCL
jgi:hypothetical protein